MSHFVTQPQKAVYFGGLSRNLKNDGNGPGINFHKIYPLLCSIICEMKLTVESYVRN